MSLFVRFPSSFIGHNQPLIRLQENKTLDYEGEVAIIIGTIIIGIITGISAQPSAGGYCPYPTPFCLGLMGILRSSKAGLKAGFWSV